MGTSTDLNHNGTAGRGGCDDLSDLNCDGRLTFSDVNPFVLALSKAGEYERQYPRLHNQTRRLQR